MNAIAAVDENWGIGQNGKLLLHLPRDLQYFKEKTIGKTIIIGRETFDGMGGRLLSGRETVILSQNGDFKPNCPVLHSAEEVLDYVKDKNPDEVFAAGGEAIYRLLLPYCDKIFITKIYAAFDADRHFPNLDKAERDFAMWEIGGIREENGFKYQFLEYKRKK